jgi:hypothetical protein
MKVLNIIRSESDDMVAQCVEAFSKDEEAKRIALYEGDVDWSVLVDEIFAHDKVICWW